ncbi:SLOG family protein [Companilactobacillus crustorum]|uniref:SLOG family protein n=1 Tax=Companilactobacillus crustorum TaxID=392416 RepID=UPI00237E4AF2|nr:SLOG family protein [Companilactobacillus crustorum]WDT66589.1 SLOG family protein [Companilactobacillus crustorum]
MIKNLWVTGYRSYELGIFKDNDPKAKVIQDFFIQSITNYAEDGTEWIITGAQMGTEQIIGKAVQEVQKKDYNIKHAVILPFAEFGNKWNENNQALLNVFLRNADYVNKISNLSYHSPRQLRVWQDFMLAHTDGALVFYDPESGGKPKYDYEAIKKYQDSGNDYQLELIDFDSMQDFANMLYDS